MQPNGLTKQAALAAAGETIRSLVAEIHELRDSNSEHERTQKIASIASMAKDRGIIDDDSRDDFVEDLEARDEHGLDVAAEGVRYAANAPSLGTLEKGAEVGSGSAVNQLDSYLDQRASGIDV